MNITRTARNILLAAFALLLAMPLVAAMPASAQEASYVSTRVDLILENGTLLIYRGKEAGYTEGQVLNVYRGGTLIGTVKVTRVMRPYVQAQIVTNEKGISEGDTVGPESSAAKVVKSPAASTAVPVQKKDDSAAKADTTKKDTAAKTDTAAKPAAAAGDKKPAASAAPSGRSRGGSSSAASSSTAAAPSSGAAAPAASSSRRGRGSASTSSASGDAAAAPADTAAASSAGSSRRGRGSTAASSDSGSSESSDTAASGDAASGDSSQPKVLGAAPYYVYSAGYFYLKGDFPGNVVSNKPSMKLGVTYWKPLKKKKNIVYGVSYTRPVITTTLAGQQYRIQYRISEVTAGYIWDNIGSFAVSKTSSTFGGFTVGYRNASTKTSCTITCNGYENELEKSLEGLDYHGVVGFRFQKSMELKLDYSFDEKYYSIDAGYKY